MTAPGAGLAPAYLPPKPRQSFSAHVVVDIRTTPPTPVEMKILRSDARKYITWSPDAAHLRIKRAKVTLFAK